MSVLKDLPLGAVEPAIAIALAKAHAEHLADWLAHAECFANPEEHAKHFRACWRRVLWLRRSLDRLASRLDRGKRRIEARISAESTLTRPKGTPGTRSARGAAASGLQTGQSE